MSPVLVAVIVAAPFVGSFLGVLVLRLPEGEPVLLSRSRCGSCGARLGPLDLVPFASFLLSGGRCRHCGTRLSWFYPGIEAAALLVAIWAATETTGWLLWASCGLGWTLLTLSLIDARHFYLPDGLTLPLLVCGLALAWVLQGALPVENGLAAVGGFVAFRGVALIYRRLRGREGLGAGDAKLIAAAGAWVSWQGLPGVVLIAATATLVVELLRRAIFSAADEQVPIPFGPGLSLGIWLVWLYGPIVLVS